MNRVGRWKNRQNEAVRGWWTVKWGGNSVGPVPFPSLPVERIYEIARYLVIQHRAGVEIPEVED